MKFTCQALAFASLLTVQTVAAQTSSDSLTEIVVTAQRRAERLQDVPAAITAQPDAPAG
jgi:outer membrane receptor protein involved in Fe transport